MKYAKVNDSRTEATKGAKGLCPSCGAEVIAKCGEQKINHWAHKGIRSCDPWWEPETEWHRSWKNKFPLQWQEIILYDDKTGEKHIADIRTNQGVVVEFQHSQINSVERLSREKFYASMVWVVDGSRLKRDYARFLKGIGTFKLIKNWAYKVDFPEEYFAKDWLDSKVPVIFDFLDNELSFEENHELRRILYCLFPTRIESCVFIAAIPRNVFVKSINEETFNKWAGEIINNINQVQKEHQEQRSNMSNRSISRPNYYDRSRRRF